MDWMLMPFRRYAEFSGRSRRREYWMFTLLMAIVYLVGLALMVAGGLPAMMDAPDAAPPFTPMFWLGAGLCALFFLVSLIPAIAVTVRRLHDRNLSGWWYLGVAILGQIPYLGALISLGFLVVMALPGTPGSNRFGSDPKDPARAEVFA